MALVEVTIKGITPYLMHRFGEEAEQGKPTRLINIEERTPRAEAEKTVYRAPDGTFYFRGAAIAGVISQAGAEHKQKGSRRTLRFITPAAVLVLEDAITLRDDSGEPLGDYEVDSRPVTIPSTKGRIMRHRARFDTWTAAFTLEIETQLLSTETIHQLLTEGGSRIGIGDYRPEKRGPFGRFRVVRWEEQPQAVAAE